MPRPWPVRAGDGDFGLGMRKILRSIRRQDGALLIELQAGVLFKPSPNFTNAAGHGKRGHAPALHHPVLGAGHHTLPVGVEGRAEDGIPVV